MLPSWVRMVCVDINPAVVTKLADRGSSQTLGIVTDVSLFVHQLHRRLVADAVRAAIGLAGCRASTSGPTSNHGLAVRSQSGST